MSSARFRDAAVYALGLGVAALALVAVCDGPSAAQPPQATPPSLTQPLNRAPAPLVRLAPLPIGGQPPPARDAAKPHAPVPHAATHSGGGPVPAATAPVHAGTGAADLNMMQLGASVPIMAVTMGVSHFLDLKQDRYIAVATLRTILQLSALGYILSPIFHNNEPYVVLPWVTAMCLLAAREVWAKPKYGFRGMFRHIFGSILTGLLLIMSFATVRVFQQRPWWDAKLLIPVCGMLLGNALTSVSLSLNTLLNDLAEGTAKIELLLTRGATSMEAILPTLQAAVNVGITPTLNSMNVIGLVSLPGMMTGQILGGGPPAVAAKYQMMIMFLISGCGVCSMLCMQLLASRSMFDDRSRLRAECLTKRTSNQKDLLLWLLSLAWQFLQGSWRVLTNAPSPAPAPDTKTNSEINASKEEMLPLLLAQNHRSSWSLTPTDKSKADPFFTAAGLGHAFGRRLLWSCPCPCPCPCLGPGSPGARSARGSEKGPKNTNFAKIIQKQSNSGRFWVSGGPAGHRTCICRPNRRG